MINKQTTQKEFVHIFYLLSYFRNFLPRFSQLTINIKAAKNGQPYKLEDCITELEAIKKWIGQSPTLPTPSIDSVIEIYTDFSQTGIAACFTFLNNGKQFPFHFLSRATTAAESQLSAIEGEALAIKWTLDKMEKEFIPYHNVTIYSDQQPLIQLINSDLSHSTISPTLLRKITFIQKHPFSFKYIVSTKNKADALSRLYLSS